MRGLVGRTAAVIGDGSGVGRGIALGLAAEGVRVAVADIHRESAFAVRDEIAATGATAIAAETDDVDFYVRSPASTDGRSGASRRSTIAATNAPSGGSIP